MNDEKIPDAVRAQATASGALLPCPFCGNAGHAVIVDDMGARCCLCKALGPMLDEFGKSVHMTPTRARAAWNRRAPASVSEGPSRGADAPLAHQEQDAVAEALRQRDRHAQREQEANDARDSLARDYDRMHAMLDAAQATAERLTAALEEARKAEAILHAGGETWIEREAWSILRFALRQAGIEPLPPAASDSAKDKETGK